MPDQEEVTTTPIGDLTAWTEDRVHVLARMAAHCHSFAGMRNAPPAIPLTVRA